LNASALVRNGPVFAFLKPRTYHQNAGGDADTGIGNIERGPWIGVGDMQVEQQKVDDVMMADAIREVAQDPGAQETDGEARDSVLESPSHGKHRKSDQGEHRKSDEDSVLLAERAERSPGITPVNECEETGKGGRHQL